MKLITRQILADEAPARFAAQYSKKQYAHLDQTVTIMKLQSLPKPVNPYAVDLIIGNTSWTSVPRCDECGTYGHDAVVEVGEEPDYESHTAYLCLSCAQKAVETLKGSP